MYVKKETTSRTQKLCLSNAFPRLVWSFAIFKVFTPQIWSTFKFKQGKHDKNDLILILLLVSVKNMHYILLLLKKGEFDNTKQF